tara:strand:- start:1308 stop:2165 length:858 start_codon:yes stop_codon:yes gene_type:complete
MTKSKEKKNSDDENSVTNQESVNQSSSVEQIIQEQETNQISNESNDKELNIATEENKGENLKADSVVSDDSDVDIVNDSTINTTSEKLISSESESEKESEKEDSDDDSKNLKALAVNDNLKINHVKTVTPENFISITLKNEDLIKSNLSNIEKQIIKKIFVKSIDSIREVIDNPNIESVIAITIIITNIADLLENIRINSASNKDKLSGSIKKNIVIFLGRLFIEKIGFSEQENMLAVYDVCADNVLERIIKFAKNNKVSHLVEGKFDESVNHLKNKSIGCCIIS